MLGHDAVGIARIAKETGLTRQTVYRIKDDPVGAEAALAVGGFDGLPPVGGSARTACPFSDGLQLSVTQPLSRQAAYAITMSARSRTSGRSTRLSVHQFFDFFTEGP
jgi:Helix-turn-helix domain of resolvase